MLAQVEGVPGPAFRSVPGERIEPVRDHASVRCRRVNPATGAREFQSINRILNPDRYETLVRAACAIAGLPEPAV